MLVTAMDAGDRSLINCRSVANNSDLPEVKIDGNPRQHEATQGPSRGQAHLRDRTADRLGNLPQLLYEFHELGRE